VQEQDGEQSTPPPRAELDQAVGRDDLERPQDAKVDAVLLALPPVYRPLVTTSNHEAEPFQNQGRGPA
jgi:hypothetical protein